MLFCRTLTVAESQVIFLSAPASFPWRCPCVYSSLRRGFYAMSLGDFTDDALLFEVDDDSALRDAPIACVFPPFFLFVCSSTFILCLSFILYTVNTQLCDASNCKN